MKPSRRHFAVRGFFLPCAPNFCGSEHERSNSPRFPLRAREVTNASPSRPGRPADGGGVAPPGSAQPPAEGPPPAGPPPGAGARQKRPRRPGSLWAAGGEWQAAASPSYTPVTVSPPSAAAAAAGHLRAAVPPACRRARSHTGCGDIGRRLGRGRRRRQERRCSQRAGAATRLGGGAGERARLRVSRRAALRFLSLPPS